MKENTTSQQGFSLIEVLIAMAVLGIGLLTLITMQVTGIKGNAKASNITTASNWGSDKIEQIFALDYDHPDLKDDGQTDNSKLPHTADNAAGLNNTDTTALPPDGMETSPDGRYTIFWNIDETNILANTKTIRVIIVRTDDGKTRTVTMDYMKSEYM